jgi:hypothetical protein
MVQEVSEERHEAFAQTPNVTRHKSGILKSGGNGKAANCLTATHVAVISGRHGRRRYNDSGFKGKSLLKI